MLEIAVELSLLPTSVLDSGVVVDDGLPSTCSVSAGPSKSSYGRPIRMKTSMSSSATFPSRTGLTYHEPPILLRLEARGHLPSGYMVSSW